MIEKSEFESWKGHPTTRKYLQYLTDWREDLKERWADGQIVDEYTQKMAQCLGDIVDLQHESIEEFYASEEQVDEE